MTPIHWRCLAYNELSRDELYALLQLRCEVFVVEQECIFQDLDGHDQTSMHVLGYRGDELVLYARLLPPGLAYADVSMGRILSAMAIRGEGLGRALITESIAHCHRLWPQGNIRISAQQQLLKLYEDFGFTLVSEPYMEDGILHSEMLLLAPTTK